MSRSGVQGIGRGVVGGVVGGPRTCGSGYEASAVASGLGFGAGLVGAGGGAVSRAGRRALGGCSGDGESSDPVQRGDVVALPGPAGREMQRPRAAVTGEPAGNMQQPAAQGSGGANRCVR
jgi:hypothetical protein